MSAETKQIEREDTSALGDRMLMFRAGSGRYTLPLAIVVEVLEIAAPAAAVPGAPAWVAGMINHHGRVIPVLDMSMLAGGGLSPGAAQIVLVELAGERMGLAVDQIESLEEADLKVTGPVNGSGGRRAWHKGEMIEMFDGAALLKAIERNLERHGAEVDVLPPA